MKNKLVLAFLLCLLVVFLMSCSTNEENLSSIKKGKYFDEEGDLLGSCTEEKEAIDDVSGNNIKRFYDLEKNLIGSCWSYYGPGSSGWKGGCDEKSVKNAIAKRIEGGTYHGRIAQTATCEFE